MDSIIIHPLMCYSILSCIHNHHIAVHMSQDWMKWAKDHLIFTLVSYTTHSHCTQVSRDHLMCMMDLTRSGELESVYLQAGGRGPEHR